MQDRFQGLEFPSWLVAFSLGFVGVFIILYILAYLLFKRVKYRLPYLRRIKANPNAVKLQGGTRQPGWAQALPAQRRPRVRRPGVSLGNPHKLIVLYKIMIKYTKSK